LPETANERPAVNQGNRASLRSVNSGLLGVRQERGALSARSPPGGEVADAGTSPAAARTLPGSPGLSGWGQKASRLALHLAAALDQLAAPATLALVMYRFFALPPFVALHRL